MGKIEASGARYFCTEGYAESQAALAYLEAKLNLTEEQSPLGNGGVRQSSMRRRGGARPVPNAKRRRLSRKRRSIARRASKKR